MCNASNAVRGTLCDVVSLRGHMENVGVAVRSMSEHIRYI